MACRSRPEPAGTDYTLQTSLAVFCSDVAGAGGLALAGSLGYATVITGSMLLAVGGLVATASLLHPRQCLRHQHHAGHGALG